ncbi:immune inhibitor A [Clostridium felsineum]|uniref:immune inhibitor A n=1 Tax=Clostridium felsineum TaxID=36839 RepID=UPI00214D9115|nr:immune inhibitor A domain-containing protein [Clostridium felsineum]MCR3759452.1 immune inhibitor A [Clostridium felsineum]
MSKSKILSLLTSIVVTFSTLANYSITIHAAAKDNVVSITNQTGTDAAIANDEKLIEMLKKNGTIPQNATSDEAYKILNTYLSKNKTKDTNDPTKLDIKSVQGLKKYSKEAISKGLLQKKNKKNNPQTTWDGSVTKDKALVILVEFPDLSHDTLTPKDTDMYYKDYPTSHYQDMIFGPNGYTGPNGENFVSLKQYYNKQSGGSYDINGTVVGWYKAQHPAAYYGANQGGDNSPRARDLVKEALTEAAKHIDLKQFDVKDPYDLNGDGNLNEPDGIIDHLMIIHSGMGEEAGGGSIGTDAIWSHSSKVYDMENGTAKPWKIPGTDMSAYPYTIMPEDGAAGVFCHEFGHDLGLPDEYDTQYSGKGEPVGYWSIMSDGSWSGTIPGTEPSGFSAYDKEYFQKRYGGNWFHGNTIDLSQLDKKGKKYTLDAASEKSVNNDFVKVTLPKKSTTITKPSSGNYLYFSGKGDNLSNSMLTTIDLTNATSADFNFKTWYNIEQDWDYGSVQVQIAGTNTWTSIPGNITTTTNPNNQNPGNGITGKSNGWTDAKFDLKDYIGKKITLKLNYWTDAGGDMDGLYVDDLSLNIDGKQAFLDDAEGTASHFILNGFTKDSGVKLTDQYYLMELRNHYGTDSGLGHIKRGASIMSYDPGVLVWYVDNLYSDNWTGIHPGHGFLSVVDADQHLLRWSDGSLAENRYEMHDAAFTTKKSEKMFLDYTNSSTPRTLTDDVISKHPTFEDDRTYITDELPDVGVLLPHFGLKMNVIDQTDDSSHANIELKLK